MSSDHVFSIYDHYANNDKKLIQRIDKFTPINYGEYSKDNSSYISELSSNDFCFNDFFDSKMQLIISRMVSALNKSDNSHLTSVLLAGMKQHKQAQERVTKKEYLDLVNYIYNGKKTFVFSKNLVSCLKETNMDTDSSFLNIPFPCCEFIYNEDELLQACNVLYAERTSSYSSYGFNNINNAASLSCVLQKIKQEHGATELIISVYFLLGDSVERLLINMFSVTFDVSKGLMVSELINQAYEKERTAALQDVSASTIDTLTELLQKSIDSDVLKLELIHFMTNFKDRYSEKNDFSEITERLSSNFNNPDLLKTRLSEIQLYKTQELNDIIKLFELKDKTINEEYLDKYFLIFHVVFNSILYLQSEHAEKSEKETNFSKLESAFINERNKKEKERIKSALNNSTRLNITSVGESVHPIIIDKSYVYEESESKGNIYQRRNIRYMVRGHFRNQPHGKNREQHKLIWIAPFYKGPDIATLVSNTYIVK